MPSHQERVRANYRCPDCDGEGVVVEPYEGSWPCSTCHGGGVRLLPVTVAARGRPLSSVEQWMVDEQLSLLKNQLRLSAFVTRRVVGLAHE